MTSCDVFILFLTIEALSHVLPLVEYFLLKINEVQTRNL